MNNRLEELQFGKQMDNADDKKRIIELVKNNHCSNVLDLGAGTGIVSKQISELNIKTSAVDNNFKINEYQNTNFLFYYSCNLIEFIKTTKEKYDCIILSAVLHELSKKEFNYLKKNLYKIINSNKCIIIIREPYYEKMANGQIKPFKNKDVQFTTSNLIKVSTPDDFKKRFIQTPKISERKVPKEINSINMAFTYSYGQDSWYRELKENRFAFSKKDLKDFCEQVLGKKQIEITYEYFNKNYKPFFESCNYPKTILDNIEYTNCLIVAQKK